MDLRFSYDKIRRLIEDASFENLDNDGQLVKDLKFRMLNHIDQIEDLIEEKADIDRKIKFHRACIKDMAESWDI